MDTDLVQYPDPILTTPTEKVVDLKEASSIALTMKAHYIRNNPDLVGLAANQIGIGKRICVVSMEDSHGSWWEVMINPEIVSTSVERVTEEEGCGSLRNPKLFVRVSRPAKVHVKYFNPDYGELESELDGFNARVVQHEIDHLDGILILDHGEAYEHSD